MVDGHIERPFILLDQLDPQVDDDACSVKTGRWRKQDESRIQGHESPLVNDELVYNRFMSHDPLIIGNHTRLDQREM